MHNNIKKAILKVLLKEAGWPENAKAFKELGDNWRLVEKLFGGAKLNAEVVKGKVNPLIVENVNNMRLKLETLEALKPNLEGVSPIVKDKVISSVIGNTEVVKPKRGIGKAILRGASVPLGFAAVVGAMAAGENVIDRMRYKAHLKSLFEDNKELKEFSKTDVETAYATLYELHPELARNSGVAGEWIRSALISGIKAPPIDIAYKLLDKGKGDTHSQTLFRGFVGGMGGEALKSWKDMSGIDGG